jgi:hypothetical protein
VSPFLPTNQKDIVRSEALLLMSSRSEFKRLDWHAANVVTKTIRVDSLKCLRARSEAAVYAFGF